LIDRTVKICLWIAYDVFFNDVVYIENNNNIFFLLYNSRSRNNFFWRRLAPKKILLIYFTFIRSKNSKSFILSSFAKKFINFIYSGQNKFLNGKEILLNHFAIYCESRKVLSIIKHRRNCSYALVLYTVFRRRNYSNKKCNFIFSVLYTIQLI